MLQLKQCVTFMVMWCEAFSYSAKHSTIVLPRKNKLGMFDIKLFDFVYVIIKWGQADTNILKQFLNRLLQLSIHQTVQDLNFFLCYVFWQSSHVFATFRPTFFIFFNFS